MRIIERADLNLVIGGGSSPTMEPQPGGQIRQVANSNPSPPPPSGGNPYKLGGQMPSGGNFNNVDVYPKR